MRITPAHAGKTDYCRYCKYGAEDHPRSRGENFHKTGPDAYRKGSPPLTRGKLGIAVVVDIARRITPAHAGKTLDFSQHSADFKDHPRSRGENTPEEIKMVSVRGSPPLTRGKLAYSYDSDRGRGITPAHAGKTSLISGR